MILNLSLMAIFLVLTCISRLIAKKFKLHWVDDIGAASLMVFILSFILTLYGEDITPDRILAAACLSIIWGIFIYPNDRNSDKTNKRRN